MPGKRLIDIPICHDLRLIASPVAEASVHYLLLALPDIGDYPLGRVAQEISRGSFPGGEYYQAGAEIFNESRKKSDRIPRVYQM